MAVDLLGNLQQFQKSIERELQAKTMKVMEIPKLGEGEKIHIKLGTSKRRSTKTSDGNKKISGGPLLLKKPPKFDSRGNDTGANTTDMDSRAKENTGDATLDSQNGVVQASVPSEVDSDFGDDWNDFQEANPSSSAS